MRYTQPVKRRNRTVLNQRPTAGFRLEQARTLLVIAVGAASSAGCHAPDPVASAPTEASAASVSSPVVTVLLENALFRPTRLNEDELRYINHEIQALDAAAQLPGLTSDSPDEVRVWQTSATFSASPGYATVGYVVTASGVSAATSIIPQTGNHPSQQDVNAFAIRRQSWMRICSPRCFTTTIPKRAADGWMGSGTR